ncbi:PAS domain-containing sensor histidine kinase [Brevibacillus laterosporus]|uniref:histidine kinase n=1 Tax=Brevibacillus laterosporus TaxID=1465 RepID=A0A518V8R1_BRELA|nr:PAS domain-containing sensor histidine kinase [Brevibacillus laterosporus]
MREVISWLETDGFVSFVQNCPDGVLVLSLEGNVLYANESWYELAGNTLDEEYRADVDVQLLRLQQGLLQIEPGVLQTLITSHEPYIIQIPHKKGWRMDVSFTFFPIKWYKGEAAVGVLVRDVTEQKQRQKKLEENEQSFKSFIQYSYDAIFLLSPEFEVLRISNSFPIITGYSPQELYDNPRILLPDEATLLEQQQHFDHVMKTGKPVLFRTKRRHKNGDLLEICMTYKPVCNKADRIVGVVAVMRNITERVQVETELRDAKELLESFVKSASDCIVLIDLDWNILMVNPACEKMYGYSYEELIMHQENLLKPVILKGIIGNTQKAMDGKMVLDEENQFTHRNGNLVYTLSSYIPIRNHEGRILAVALITKDVTEQRRIAQALGDSEAKYRLISENMTDLIAILDRSGRYIYVSPSFQTILGYTPESLLGMDYRQWIHTEDKEFLRQGRKQLVAEGTVMQVELRYRCASGEWMYLEANGTPVFNGKQNLEHFVFVARNITDRKQAEALLRNSDKLSLIGEMAAGVAHEIRNPLTALRGFIQLLQAQTDEHHFYFEVMLSELDRINFIVSELLVLSKPQVQHVKQKNVVDLIRNVMTLLESQALMHNVVFQFDFEDQQILITCEENQIKQVFINIMKNAMEAMPNGGIIQITVKQEGQMVDICFRDEGCGIPKDRVSKLGEPFYTTKDKGTGLGLMVSKKIIRDHQGFLLIDSVINQGTTVHVNVPLSILKQ